MSQSAPTAEEMLRRYHQAKPPTPKAVLVSLLSDEKLLAEIHTSCRRTHPSYPFGGETLFLWRCLWAAGIHAPYVETVTKFDHLVKQVGWQVIPVSKSPEPGDVAIFQSGNSLGAEFVVKPVVGSADYYGVGAGQERGRRAAMNGHPHAPGGPVLYWLRRPCSECEKRRREPPNGA